MEFELSRDQIKIGTETMIPPYSIEDHIFDTERVFVVLGTFRKEGKEDPDFEVTSRDRNVVAINREAQVEWMIKPAPAQENKSEERSEGYYKELLMLQNRYLARHSCGNFEFDPKTGDILNKWSKNQFPVGDRVVELSGDILSVVEHGDAFFIACSEATHDLYAFEADGTERWRSDADERRGSISVDDGQLWERVTVNRTTDHRYRLDPNTGDRYDRTVIDTGPY